MHLTVDEISKKLGLQKEAVIAALRETGIEPDVHGELDPKEFGSLRRVLYRYYQDSMRQKTGENCAEATGNRSSAEADNKEGNPVKESVLLRNEPDTYRNESDTAQNEPDEEIVNLVQTHHIMIDTCSFMHDGCEAFSDRLLPALKRCSRKVIIPQKVLLELKKHAENKTDPNKSRTARKGLAICEKFLKEGCLTVKGSPTDNFADNVIFVSFSQYRLKYKMVLITQDRHLTNDILQLNEMKSAAGKQVRVFRITNAGDLIESI